MSQKPDEKRQLHLLRHICEQTSDLVAVVDAHGHYVYVNSRLCQQTGFTANELLTSRVADLVLFCDKECLHELCTSQTDPLPAFQSLLRRKDGSSFYVEVSPSRLELDGEVFVCSIARDITHHLRWKTTLDEQAATFIWAQRCARAGVWDLNLVTNRAHWSDPYYELYGLPKEVVPSRENWIASIHPEDRDRVEQQFLQTIAKGGSQRIEYRILRNAEVRWLSSEGQVTTDASGRPVRVAGITWDITERKQTEAALAESEATLQTAIDAADLGTWDFDLQTDTAPKRSLRHDQIFGYSTLQASWGPAVVERHLLDEDKPAYRAAVTHAITSGRLAFEGRIRWPDGSVHWIAASGRTYYDSQGKAVRMSGVVADITRQKNAEAALEESLKRERLRATELKTMLDTAPIGLAITLDPDGHHIKGNRTAELLFNLDASGEMSKQAPQAAHFIPLQHGREVKFEELPITRAARGEVVTGQTMDVVCRDGRTISIFAKATPLFDEAGNPRGAIGAFLDISPLKQAENALRAAHDTLRHLVEQSPFGVYVVDANFRLLEVSVGAKKIFENVQPLIGRDFAEVLHLLWPESFANEAIAEFRHTLATGEPYHSPSTVERRRDIDQTEAYDWKIERIVLPDGRFGVVCHFYDLSERQRYEAQLREREERFRAVFENAGTGIAITDLDGHFEHCNPAYCRLLNYTEEELQQLVVLDLVHPDDRNTNQAAVLSLCSGTVRYFEIENRYVRKNGEAVWVHKFVSLLPDIRGVPAHMMALVTDVTDRRRAEQALRDADRRKDEFLATLAHELRNPLAPMNNALHILQNFRETQINTSELLSMLGRQLKHLNRLVDDILEVSRITRGKIELQKEYVDLAEVIRQSVETSQPLIEANKHELSVRLPTESLMIEGDIVRLTQVFTNVLNNAAKFTAPGGKIKLTIEQCKHEAIVSIKDTGCGISAEMLPRIFDLFAQADNSRQRTHGGLGIGLTLVRYLINMHGGEVTAHSKGPKCGSEFVVRLPLANTISRTAHHGPVEKFESSSRRHILVVDDNIDAADSLALLLRSSGNQVHVAYDGKSGLTQFELFRPEIVLLDLGMPDMDGLDAARCIRQLPGGHQATLIAITGWGQEDDRRLTAEAGFNHHLVKPVNLALLQSLLQHRG